MSYVIGVNRIGVDGKNISYSGDSSVFGPLGELLWQQSGHTAVHTVTIDKEAVSGARNHFPFLNDADKFMLL